MVGAAFAAQAGLLRLPALAIELLGRLAGGDDPSRLRSWGPDALALLQHLGVIEDARVHPAVEPLAGAVGTPLVRLVVRVGPPAAPVEARAWLDAGFAAYAHPLGADLYELVPGLPSGAPVFAAGLVDLGPRPPLALAGMVTLPDRAVRALLGRALTTEPGAVLAAAAVPQEWREPLLALAEGCRSTWSVQARWMVGEGQAARATMAAVDGGAAGLWRYARRTVDDRDLAFMRPVRTRDVWRELCALLPTEQELLASSTTPT